MLSQESPELINLLKESSDPIADSRVRAINCMYRYRAGIPRPTKFEIVMETWRFSRELCKSVLSFVVKVQRESALN